MGETCCIQGGTEKTRRMVGVNEPKWPKWNAGPISMPKKGERSRVKVGSWKSLQSGVDKVTLRHGHLFGWLNSTLSGLYHSSARTVILRLGDFG